MTATPMQTVSDDALRQIPAPIIRVILANGYLYPKVIGANRYACVMPLMFTAAIITIAKESAAYSYEDRWCYHSVAVARAALEAWDDASPPAGIVIPQVACGARTAILWRNMSTHDLS